MKRAKVKKIKIPLGEQDEGLAEMFNQMLGTGVVNIMIAYPRYKKIKSLCENLIKVFKLMVDSPFMKHYTMFGEQKTQIDTFCTTSTKSIAELFSVDLPEYEWNLNLVPDDKKKQFSDIYETVKQSELINTFIIICDRLVPYRKNFTDAAKYNHKFITTMAGVEWYPFPFTNLNIKHVFTLGLNKGTISFFMTIFAKTYELSRYLYDEIREPDVDIDQFVDFIYKNIGKLERVPELHRCRDAFNKIRESIALLKNKFSGYYHDFVNTKDSTIIMQHFILDVSKSTEADAKTMRQFYKIINYYKKLENSQSQNPRVSALLSAAQQKFGEIIRGTENLVQVEDSDEESIDDDSQPIVLDSVAKTSDQLDKELNGNTLPPGSNVVDTVTG